MNRKDLRASTLVGLSWENPILDPLAVPHLDNPLYIHSLNAFQGVRCGSLDQLVPPVLFAYFASELS